VSANAITGADTYSSSTTDNSTGTKSGGDSQTSYGQSSTDSWSTTVDETGNEITGSESTASRHVVTSSLLETGSDQNDTYTIQENDLNANAVQDTGNAITGTDNSTTSSASTSSVQEIGSDNSGDSFDLTKTDASSGGSQQTSDDITGSYTSMTSATETTTSQETTSNSVGGSTFTEIVSQTSSLQDTGDSVTGSYSQALSETTTTTDTDSGVDAAGTFWLTESNSQSMTGQQTGDQVSGDYTLSQSASATYSLSESGSNATSDFTLVETGANCPTTQETGNKVVGSYTQSVSGADAYTLIEIGADSFGDFTETVTGSDSFSQTKSGDPANQTYVRTQSGTGSYSLQDTGTGATLPSGTGTIAYTVQETADARSGDLRQSETGQDRYALLECFNNVSNTGNGNSPGNMNYSPFGDPFVDPDAERQAPVADGSNLTWITQARMQDLVTRGLAHTVTGPSGEAHRVIIMPYGREIRAFDYKEVVNPGTGNREWRLARSYCVAPITDQADIARAMTNVDTDQTANRLARATDDFGAAAGQLAGLQTVITAISMAPLGASADGITRGDYVNAAVSFVGDVCFFGSILARASARAASDARVASAAVRLDRANRALVRFQAIEGVIALTRLGQGGYAIMQGENGRAVGYFGEALFRILGVAYARRVPRNNSRAAVEALADSYRGQLSSGGPRTVARLQTGNGAFNGRSGYSGGMHPVVQQLVDANPGRFNGACAECDAVSQALRAAEARTGQAITTVEQARQALAGSSLQTARVRGPNSTAHGTPIPPCETCQPLLDALGITLE
jgi:YwqJ-like deaminase